MDAIPIVAYEFLGSSVEGKIDFIIDDMISLWREHAGHLPRALKSARQNVVVCATFGLFTINGPEKFDEFFCKKVTSTAL